LKRRQCDYRATPRGGCSQCLCASGARGFVRFGAISRDEIAMIDAALNPAGMPVDKVVIAAK